MSETTRIICGVPFSEKDEARFWDKVHWEPMSGCALWGGVRDIRGYGAFRFRSTHVFKSHRVAFELERGPIPDGLLIRHFVCDNPVCVNERHLAIGTDRDNVRDMIRHGRMPRGGQRSHVSDEQAAEMLRRRRAGESGAALSREFGVTSGAVCNLFKGRTWKHLSQQSD